MLLCVAVCCCWCVRAALLSLTCAKTAIRLDKKSLSRLTASLLRSKRARTSAGRLDDAEPSDL